MGFPFVVRNKESNINQCVSQRVIYLAKPINLLPYFKALIPPYRNVQLVFLCIIKKQKLLQNYCFSLYPIKILGPMLDWAIIRKFQTI